MTLLISGPNKSGKTTIAQILHSEGICVLELGQLVRIEHHRTMHAGTVTDFRNSNFDSISNLLKHNISQLASSKDLIAIVGFRTKEMYDFAKNRYPLSTSIYIDTPIDIRFSRYRKHTDRRNEPLLSYQDFIQESKIHDQMGLDYIKSKADLIISGESPTNEIIHTIHKTIGRKK